MRAQRRLALWVGLASLAMVLCIVGLIIWKSGLVLRSRGYRIVGEFSEVGGLLSGAEVRYRGYPIGRVHNVIPIPQHVLVQMWIRRDVRIPVGSLLRIAFDGLIGEKFIDVQPAIGSKEMIKEDDVLYGFSSASLVDFVDEGTQSLKEMKLIINELRNILTDKDVNQSLRAAILNVGDISETLKELANRTKMATDELQFGETLKKVQAIVNSMDALTRGLAQNNEFAQSITQGSKDFAQFAHNLRVISDNLESVLGDQGVSEDLRGTVHHLREIAGQFESLSKDGQFRSSVIDTVSETQSTLKAAGNVIRGIGNVQAGTGVLYRSASAGYNFETNLRMGVDPFYLHFGLNDFTGSTALSSFQQGYRVWPNLEGRLGLFYNQPGLGMDIFLFDLLGVSTEFYDLNRRRLDIQGTLWLPGSLKLMVKANDALNRSFSDVSVGLGLGL